MAISLSTSTVTGVRRAFQRTKMATSWTWTKSTSCMASLPAHRHRGTFVASGCGTLSKAPPTWPIFRAAGWPPKLTLPARLPSYTMLPTRLTATQRRPTMTKSATVTGVVASTHLKPLGLRIQVWATRAVTGFSSIPDPSKPSLVLSSRAAEPATSFSAPFWPGFPMMVQSGWMSSAGAPSLVAPTGMPKTRSISPSRCSLATCAFMRTPTTTGPRGVQAFFCARRTAKANTSTTSC
mmetsp:Transcript_95913/g.140130  ORF Transcript_95913/g.140130 Transcript_95913/m.140130 type:complete len:237 (+) Transcript_95913:1735-2445(+)